MGNQKSLVNSSSSKEQRKSVLNRNYKIINLKLKQTCKNTPSSTKKKSNSLNSLSNQKQSKMTLRPKSLFILKSSLQKKITNKENITKTNQEQSEYSNINEYNSFYEQEIKNLDNYFNIDDFSNAQINKERAKSQPVLLPNTQIDSNIYSTVDKIITSTSMNSCNKNKLSLTKRYQNHLQPLTKIILKLTKHNKKLLSTSNVDLPPVKSFDPNEEIYQLNEQVESKNECKAIVPELNLYTDMFESINSSVSKIKNDLEDNYQSVQEQYDYSIILDEKDSLKDVESKNEVCLKQSPPPLPPASTQPNRSQKISQIFTKIEPLNVNNQVYYSFTSENGSFSDNLISSSTSFSCLSSTNSSIKNKNEQLNTNNSINNNNNNVIANNKNLSILFSSSSISTSSSVSTNPNNESDYKQCLNLINSTKKIVHV